MNALEQAEAHRHNEQTLATKGSTVEKENADRLRAMAEMFPIIEGGKFPPPSPPSPEALAAAQRLAEIEKKIPPAPPIPWPRRLRIFDEFNK